MMADPTTCYADDCENPSTHGIHILWTIGSQVSRYACCEHVMAVLCEAVEESGNPVIERLTIQPEVASAEDAE